MNTMNKELLEIIACPKCKKELFLNPEGNKLCCPVCRLAYRIDDGIPILMIDEAQPL